MGAVYEGNDFEQEVYEFKVAIKAQQGFSSLVLIDDVAIPVWPLLFLIELWVDAKSLIFN